MNKTIASVDSSKYADRYRQLTAVVNGFSQEKLNSDCAEMIPQIDQMIPEMEKDYEAYLDILDADQRRQAAAWRDALEMIASMANAFGQAARTQGAFPTIPIPSGRVDFGQRRSGTYNHYPVNTLGGQRQCHVPSSGYTFCN